MLKLFVDEEGSAAMRRFAVEEGDETKVVSAIARVEANSAICRLRKRLRLTESEAASILDAVAEEVQHLTEQPITTRVLDAAAMVVNRYSIRSLDAIHLGSAIVIRDVFLMTDVRFITSDRELLNAASLEGFLTWDPTAWLAS